MQTPVRGKSKQINSILTGGLCLNVLGFSAGCQKGPKARAQLGQDRSVQNVCTSQVWGLSRGLFHVYIYYIQHMYIFIDKYI